ncbi:AMP-binding protein [Sphingomonas sp. 1P06PA]|uniref:AMP-binding protein n=1 Tax=Sphingomonas sp. 1P06PA TaxID=554121 RepID=UPI0039A53329
MAQPAPPEDLVSMLTRQAAARPEAACLSFEDRTASFADLDDASDRVAAALKAAGIVAGDRVSILAPASPAFFELLFGCAKAGAILVPINIRLSPREIDEILADAEPHLLFVSNDLATALPPPRGWRSYDVEADYPAWRDTAAAGPVDPAAPDAPVLLLYTSGTTGRAKGATLSHRNLSYLGRMAGELWSFTPDSVNLVAMPLFHIGGIGYGLLALSQGGETVLTRATDPGALLALLARHHVTHAFFVPTVIQRLVDHAEAQGIVPPHVPHLLYGAAPIGEALLRRAITMFAAGFHHVYGMTETAGTVVTLDPQDHDPDGAGARRLRSCGRPMPWVELEIVDPATGQRQPAGQIGEIRLRSPAIMRDYWRKPAETAAAITSDGWLCTGDAAFRDADGYVFIQDRYKDMIVSGGENIYPSEIDNILAHHPDVAEVAVVGVPHPAWGETPRAYVVARAGRVPTEAALIEWLRERLARYKCPTSIRFVSALPRSASGKILKRELRDGLT